MATLGRSTWIVLAPLILSTVASAGASDENGLSIDEICKMVLDTVPPVTKCGSITERSGAQHYWLEFDHDPLASLANMKDAASARLGAHIYAGLITPLDADSVHDDPAVRSRRPNGEVVELSRSEYQVCAKRHGKIILNFDESEFEKHFACIREMLTKKEAAAAGSPSR